MKLGRGIEGLYALALFALPGSVRRADGGAILETFRDQLADPEVSRPRVVARAFLRLPGLILREWLDRVLGGPAHMNQPGGARVTMGRGERMGSMFRLVRHALRGLRKAPTFSVASVVLIALGVGASVAVFTIVNGVLLRPLPYPAAERLTFLSNGSHGGQVLERIPNIDAFESWTTTSGSSVNLTRNDGDPLRLLRVETTPAFFQLFGARPQLGRVLSEADRGNLSIAVLTHDSWSSVWNADPDIVGRTIRIDGEPIEVVGVLDSSFRPPERLMGRTVAYFRPMNWDNPNFDEPGYHAHQVVARLKPGITLEVANQQIDQMEIEIAEALPDYYRNGPRDWPLVDLRSETVGDVRSGLVLLLGAVGLLLLVACANVAHLFMARGLSRGREMAIRRAMGARSTNLVGQLATESLLVGAIGGGLGLLLAQGTLRLFQEATVNLPRAQAITLDMRVVAVAALLSAGTALLFGLVPALRALGQDVQDGLRGSGRGITGGRRTRALRSGLVVAEVALSVVLVAGAGLLMRSFMHVNGREPGVDPEGAWVIPLNISGTDNAEDFRQRMGALTEAVAGIPGVGSAAYGMEMPFQFIGGDGCCWGSGVWPEGADRETTTPINVRMHPYSVDYFETVGTAIVAGRTWSRAEALAGGEAPVVISEELAIRLHGSAAEAVGEPVDVMDGARIVGVASPTLHYGLDQPHEYAVYLPTEVLPWGISIGSIALRSDRSDDDLAAAIRQAIWSVEPDLPIPSIRPLGLMIDASSAPRRMGGLLISTFGGVALLLAAAGLYGTLLYTVGQRRRELGIRMALGAARGHIQRGVVREGLLLAGFGVVLGGSFAWWAGRFLESFIIGVSTTDLVSLLGASGTLLATAAAAAWLPAWRAGRTDPLETLKAE